MALAAVAFITACSGDPSSARGSDDQAASLPSPDLTQIESELPELVFWDNLFYSRSEESSEEQRLIIKALSQSEDERYRALLVDLAFYPNPFTELAQELLIGRSGPFKEPEILSALENIGFKKPDDDLLVYLEFKRRLFETIDAGVASFIDATEPRTISAQEVFWGGVRVDGIPPLNEPALVTAPEAERWLGPDDYIIGVEINGDARAYPRRIIDWHEMVNDTVGGVPVSLAYCTLCGSAILYDGRYGERVYRFGTSGLLYRSNKLMYDTTTRSLWQQYGGEPVWGELVGQGIRLKVLPVVHTTWDNWLEAHPDTKVLSLSTGFGRDYSSVEGAASAYAEYWMSAALIFPAPDRDGPLKRKDCVYVVRTDEGMVVYPLELVVKKRFIEDEISGRSVVVVATEDASGARAYDSGGESFESIDLSSGFIKSRDGHYWQIRDDALVSVDGERLVRLPGHNSFWFALRNHASAFRLYGE
jgi:hypothetical protein